MMNRVRSRARARMAGADNSYDPDAQAYIAATSALFPDAVNTLVLGIKAAGLWDNHLGSLKFAVGVPSLAASLIDLRNTAFNGTAVNSPTHSATAGWGFTAASAQYIDTGWQGPATGSKASQNSIHIGARLRSGGGSGQGLCSSFKSSVFCGLLEWRNSFEQWALNAGPGGIVTSTRNPVAPGNYIGVRTAFNASALYCNGSIEATTTAISDGTVPVNVIIGGLNNDGTPQSFLTGRVSAWHAGAALDSTQASAFNALLDGYAVAVGEV